MSKTDAMEGYLHQIASYLEAVRIARGWTQQEMGDAAGTSHSTINRALQGKNKVAFEKLLALSEASGVPIPETLRGAAIAAQQPTRAREEKEDFSDIERLSLAERRALLAKLQKSLRKAG